MLPPPPDHALPPGRESVWIHDRDHEAAFPPLDGDAGADVVVVGAGIAGLTAADVLSRRGLDVRVLENRLLGSGATGFTTAKISRLQGAIHRALQRRHGPETAAAYATANHQGFEHLLARLDGLGLGATVQTRDAVSYVVDPAEASVIDEEVAAATAAGVAVTAEREVAGLDLPVIAAVRLADQAQFDPMPFLRGLARAIEKAGGRVHEHTRARAIDRVGEGHVVRTATGDIAARHVLVCTGMPLVDRGLFFARLEPVRSYCVALRLTGGAARDLPMALSVDTPTRSLRTAPDPGGTGGAGEDLLLVGGEGHTVGREPDTIGRYEELVRWAERRFPVAEVAWCWSTQDYRSVDLLPFIGGGGTLPPGLQVATGFGKWGMTNGTAAGLALADGVLGATTPWHRTMDAGRSALSGSVPSLLALNGEVAWHLVADRVATLSPSKAPAEGEAVVSPLGRRGTARVDGARRTVSAVCPHLGGVLSWNPAERSWDCPLHGSRFGCDGALLQGPAVTDLAVADD